jgi:hypothetical protein
MKIMNHCHPPKIEQIFAESEVASLFTLPLTNMS